MKNVDRGVLPKGVNKKQLNEADVFLHLLRANTFNASTASLAVFLGVVVMSIVGYYKDSNILPPLLGVLTIAATFFGRAAYITNPIKNLLEQSRESESPSSLHLD